MFSLYAQTIHEFRKAILVRDPAAKAREVPLVMGEVAPLDHLLWMLDGVEKMRFKPGKAGRWMGYVVASIELHEIPHCPQWRNHTPRFNPLFQKEFYPGTRQAVREKVEACAPGTSAQYSVVPSGQIAPYADLLWMCDQIGNMGWAKAPIAACYIGWVLAHAEMHRFWDNTTSRELIGSDVKWWK